MNLYIILLNHDFVYDITGWLNAMCNLHVTGAERH